MLAAVRVRGRPDTPDRVENILSNLGLEQKNHAVLLPETETFLGMLERAKDVVTYGDIDTETAVDLLKERGETDHGTLADRVDELGYDSVKALVEAVEED
ncbi:MAG: uL30 family ribosomal protein, partial [Candidatus Nanohaloarchaea archaeon]|nr:uL30 family ribosomal protein [Candidatus Nanohaloarchaea archaeon]